MKLLTRLQISKGPNWGGNLGLPDSTCSALNHHMIMPWRLKGQNKTMLIVQLECIQSVEMVTLMQYKWHEARNDLRDESQSITGHRVSHRQYHEPGRIRRDPCLQLCGIGGHPGWSVWSPEPPRWWQHGIHVSWVTERRFSALHVVKCESKLTPQT